MPVTVKQLRSLLGGLSYYRKFLPNLSKLLRPTTALLRQGVKSSFSSDMETTVRDLLVYVAKPSTVVFPD